MRIRVMSEKTKTYRFKKNLFFWLSILVTVGPILGFVTWALIKSNTQQKIVLSMTMIGAAIIAALSLIQKLHLRSPVFLVLVGLWYALDKLMICIVIIAICTLLDEIVLWPLYKKYRDKYHINKEIDDRMEDHGPGLERSLDRKSVV